MFPIDSKITKNNHALIEKKYEHCYKPRMKEIQLVVPESEEEIFELWRESEETFKNTLRQYDLQIKALEHLFNKIFQNQLETGDIIEIDLFEISLWLKKFKKSVRIVNENDQPEPIKDLPVNLRLNFLSEINFIYKKINENNDSHVHQEIYYSIQNAKKINPTPKTLEITHSLIATQ